MIASRRMITPVMAVATVALAAGSLAAVSFVGSIPSLGRAFQRPLSLAAQPRPASAVPATSAPSRWVSLSVEPPEIVLFGPRSEARFLVTGRDRDGVAHDVTSVASLSLANKRIAQVGSDRVIRPIGDGAGFLAVKLGSLSAKVPLEVKRMAIPAPVEFTREVVPILTRAGCNQGSCHGSQHGKGGFKLSLTGFEPQLDYFSIVKQSGGRRSVLSDPESSLLLRKATLRTPHQGGMRLQTGSPEYQLLVRWLQEAAQGPGDKDPAVTRLEAFPKQRLMSKGDRQPLVVVATYSDGVIQDVTRLARIGTLNDAIASTTPMGVVTAGGSGETAIMIRFGGQATVMGISVPFSRGLKVTEFSPVNYIDEHVQRKWRALGIPQAPLSDDSTFIRRVFVDVIGTPPTPEEVKTFLANAAPDKRAKLIDQVLNRPEYADYWTLKWGDLLRSNRGPLGPKGMWSLTNWIRAQFRDNRPLDQFVRDLISARGSTFTNGPANYYRVANNPPDLAETTAQVFLGMRLQCAKCHNHPFERWSQEDYYRFAAFFARVGLKGSEEFGIFGSEQVVRLNNGGEVYHPKSGRKMVPNPLGGYPVFMRVRDAKTTNLVDPDPDVEGDRRRLLAEWVTRDNMLFARNLANRYWGYMMGRGLVEPIDDQRITNPPSNPELLDALAKELVTSKFDVKQLIRSICNSRVYQLSSEGGAANRTDDTFYSRYTIKRLPAEVLLDTVNFATGTREKFNGLPVGTRAIQLPDPAVDSYFLDTFGRAPRVLACECERGAEPNMTQALHLMMSDLVNRKVQDGSNVISKLLAEKKSDQEIAESLYLAALGRLPRPDEQAKAVKAIADMVDRPALLPSQPVFFVKPMAFPRDDAVRVKDRRAVLEDILWALLNSKEFVFNH